MKQDSDKTAQMMSVLITVTFFPLTKLGLLYGKLEQSAFNCRYFCIRIKCIATAICLCSLLAAKAAKHYLLFTHFSLSDILGWLHSVFDVAGSWGRWRWELHCTA